MKESQQREVSGRTRSPPTGRRGRRSEIDENIDIMDFGKTRLQMTRIGMKKILTSKKI
jgi:hypothetical protein